MEVDSALIAAEAGDAELILLDLADLEFMDSSGLRTVLEAHGRSKEDRDRLRLLRGPPQVQRIFELTATARILPFAD